MFSEGTTLDKVISDGAYAELPTILESEGLNIETFKEFEP